MKIGNFLQDQVFNLAEVEKNRFEEVGSFYQGIILSSVILSAVHYAPVANFIVCFTEGRDTNRAWSTKIPQACGGWLNDCYEICQETTHIYFQMCFTHRVVSCRRTY